MYVSIKLYVYKRAVMILEKLLRVLMRNCLDFIEEEKLLQTNYLNMGERRDHILVELSPKCHPEIVV